MAQCLDGIVEVLLPLGREAALAERAQLDEVLALLTVEREVVPGGDEVRARGTCQPVLAEEVGAEAAEANPQVDLEGFAPLFARDDVCIW